MLKSKIRSEKGFTMIELLLVLLVAVFFVNAGVKAQRSMENFQLSRMAREIQSMIRKAQHMAYAQESVQVVRFDTIQQEVKLTTLTRIKETTKMPSGIKHNGSNFSNQKLYFRKKLAPNQGGTILLSSKTHEVRITVLPVTGRVKIYPATRK